MAEDPDTPQRLSPSVPKDQPLADAVSKKENDEASTEDDGVTKDKNKEKNDSSSAVQSCGSGQHHRLHHPSKTPKLSLEQLNSMAEALSKEEITAEEKQRQMGVIYSRRKRVRQKMRVDVLQHQKNELSVRNQRLRLDNDRLESTLREAVARVAGVEQHRSRGGGGAWPPPLLSSSGEPGGDRATPGGSGPGATNVGGVPGMPGPGYPFMMPHLGGDSSGTANPILNRIHPLVRLQAEMGYYYSSQHPPPNVSEFYGHMRSMDPRYHPTAAAAHHRGFYAWEQPQP